MSLNHTVDHIVRAGFEEVAFNCRWVLQYAEKFIGGRKLDPLHIIGGGANSDVWCQIYADVLNRTVKRVKNPIQCNAKGAAFVAAVGMGEITFEEIPKYTEFSGEFTPNPENRAIFDKLFKEFVNIYTQMRKIYYRLNAQ